MQEEYIEIIFNRSKVKTIILFRNKTGFNMYKEMYEKNISYESFAVDMELFDMFISNIEYVDFDYYESHSVEELMDLDNFTKKSFRLSNKKNKITIKGA